MVASMFMYESQRISPPPTVSCILPKQGPRVLKVSGERMVLCFSSRGMGSGVAQGQAQQQASGRLPRAGRAPQPGGHSPSSLVWI